MSWPIGVSTGTYYPHRATESALYEIGRAGYPVAELFLQTTSEYTPLYARRIVRSMLTAGVSVHSVHVHSWLVDPFDPYEPRRLDGERLFQQALALAARIAARAVTWHGACRDPHRAAPGESASDEAVERWLGWAEEAGVGLALENVSWCRSGSAAEIRRLRARFPALAFTFDSFQAAESGEDPVELLDAMGEALLTVHLSDYDPAGPRHLPPGRGQVDWERTLTALAERKYGGPLLLELGNIAPEEVQGKLEEGRAFLSRTISSLSLQIRLT